MSSGNVAPASFAALRARRLIRLLPSLTAFLAGTASWFATDAWIARSATPSNIEQWVELKTLMMLGGSLALAGLDQALVREPDKAGRILRWAACNIVATASVIALLASVAGYTDAPLSTAIAIAGAALSLLFFGAHRSQLRYTKAQVARDGWKLALLVLLYPLHFYLELPLNSAVILALVIGVGSGAIGAGVVRTPTTAAVTHADISDYRSAMVAGLPFMMASFALSVASYGELLLVRWFGSTADVQPYFRATVAFSYPSLMLNTYAATFLGPAIREAPRRASKLLSRISWSLAASLLLIPLVALGIGYTAEAWLFPGDPSPLWLAALLSTVAGLRFVYTIVSSYVGSLARARELWRVTLAYFLSALLTVPLCAGLIILGVSVVKAVAVTALAHWFVRLSFGWALTWRLISRHTSPELHE